MTLTPIPSQNPGETSRSTFVYRVGRLATSTGKPMLVTGAKVSVCHLIIIAPSTMLYYLLTQTTAGQPNWYALLLSKSCATSTTSSPAAAMPVLAKSTSSTSGTRLTSERDLSRKTAFKRSIWRTACTTLVQHVLHHNHRAEVVE
jgi:hypothetical protein